MANIPVAAIGDVSQTGAVVFRINAVVANGQYSPNITPDAGRLVLRAPDGYVFTDVASTTVQIGSSSVSFFREIK